MRSPSRYLLVQHHGDGRWYEAGLLDQYRRPDGWWCVVQYRTGPGEQYVLAVPATSCRPLPDGLRGVRYTVDAGCSTGGRSGPSSARLSPWRRCNGEPRGLASQIMTNPGPQADEEAAIADASAALADARELLLGEREDRLEARESAADDRESAAEDRLDARESAADARDQSLDVKAGDLRRVSEQLEQLLAAADARDQAAEIRSAAARVRELAAEARADRDWEDRDMAALHRDEAAVDSEWDRTRAAEDRDELRQLRSDTRERND